MIIYVSYPIFRRVHALVAIHTDFNMATGPDIVMDTVKLTTSFPDDYTQIRMSDNETGNVKPKSLVTFIKEKCEKGGVNMTAFKVKRDNKWISWSYHDYYRDIKCVARAFIKLGLDARHSVCVLGFNCPEWFLSTLGCIFAGGMVIFFSFLRVIFKCSRKRNNICLYYVLHTLNADIVFQLSLLVYTQQTRWKRINLFLKTARQIFWYSRMRKCLEKSRNAETSYLI